ncbi:hypothetical protein H8D30_05505 [bacterium]|nr:hypothetical protein [bacterium]
MDESVVEGNDCLIWSTTTFATLADWNQHASVLLTSLQTLADPDDYYPWPTPGQVQIQDLGNGTVHIVQETQIAAWTDAAIKAVGGVGLLGYGGIDFHLSSPCPVQATSPPADEINGEEAVWHLGVEDEIPPAFSITAQASCPPAPPP